TGCTRLVDRTVLVKAIEVDRRVGRRWVGHRQYRGCAGGGCGAGQPVFMSRRCASSCGHAGQVTIGGSVLYCTCPDTGSTAPRLGGLGHGGTVLVRSGDLTLYVA